MSEIVNFGPRPSLFRFDRRLFLGGAVMTSVAAGARRVRASTSAEVDAELPFRQIHLDFHTSELVPEVGADFDAKAFVATLKRAHVNSVNVFAKCHHGYAYYDTRIAAKHPTLKRDLLGEMVHALKSADIHVLYYYSLVWDVLVARNHPEWRQLDDAGKPIGGEASVTWPWLCMNSPYLEQVVRENEEIVGRYPVDGAWFDILKTPPEGCHCRWCRDERKRLKLPETADGFYRHGKLVAKRVQKRLFELVRAQRPGARVFFNSRLVIGSRDEMDHYTHVEIESLPTGGWGYTHFQQRVRYLRNLGRQSVGMTGRFHKSWGDFGGLKNQAALDFECLNFLANGCKASVGDQLHPRGQLDPTTYDRIGKTFAKLAALEPWARGAVPVTDIGVLSSAAVNLDLTTTKIPPVDQGFTNMLVELHQQFDVLDLESDFSRYPVLVLPDEITPSEALLAKVRAFLAGGGRLIASHASLLDQSRGRFVVDELGIEMVGLSRFRDEYMIVGKGVFPGVDEGAYFLYQRGLRIKAKPGTAVLARYGHPYFDRDPKHFVSHKQTPLQTASDEPFVTRRGNVSYVAHPIFTSYGKDAYGVSKLIVRGLLDHALPQPALRAPNLPSTAQVTVLSQKAGSSTRLIVHLLHYPQIRRAVDLDVIEDPGLLVDTEVELRCPRRPQRIELVPQGKALRYRFANGYARFVVPRTVGHQAVAISLS